MSRDLEEETGLHTGWIQNGGLFIASNRQRLDEYKRLMSVGVAPPGVGSSRSWGAGAARLGKGALTDPGHHRTQMLLLLGHLGQAAMPPRASASSPLKWAHIVERDALSPGHGRGPVRGALTAAVLSAHRRQATYDRTPRGSAHTSPPSPTTDRPGEGGCPGDWERGLCCCRSLDWAGALFCNPERPGLDPKSQDRLLQRSVLYGTLTESVLRAQ